MVFFTQQVFKLIHLLFKLWVFLLEIVLYLNLLVKNCFLVCHVWQSLNKPFNQVLNFRHHVSIRELLFFWRVFIHQFNDSGSVFTVDFLLQDFVLIFHELYVLNLLIVLLFHLTFEELNHFEYIHVGEVCSVDKKWWSIFLWDWLLRIGDRNGWKIPFVVFSRCLFEFRHFLSDEIIFLSQDHRLISFFLKGFDLVFDDFKELDCLVKWFYVGQGFTIVVQGITEIWLQTKNILKPLLLIVNEGTEFSQFVKFIIVGRVLIHLISSHDMLARIWSTVIKLRPLIVNPDLSLGIYFILRLWSHIEVIFFTTWDSFAALIFFIYLGPWLYLSDCCPILMLIVITAFEFPEMFLKFGDFFLQLLFLLVDSLKFIKCVVIDGLKLLFGLLFVLFDFFLKFFVLFLKLRDF